MKVSKEFWVSNDFIESIKDGEVSQVFITGSKIAFSTSPKKEYIHANKITITYEVDRNVTIKESKARKVLEEEIVSHATIDNIMQKLFGDKE